MFKTTQTNLALFIFFFFFCLCVKSGLGEIILIKKGNSLDIRSDCIIMTIQFVCFTKCYCNEQMKEDEMARTCSLHGKDVKCKQNLLCLKLMKIFSGYHLYELVKNNIVSGTISLSFITTWWDSLDPVSHQILMNVTQIIPEILVIFNQLTQLIA